MNMTMTLSYERRHATFVSNYDRPKLGIKAGDTVQCLVHGCFQCYDGDQDINPYFVVELEDGNCTYVAPEDLTFIKEDKSDATDSN